MTPGTLAAAIALIWVGMLFVLLRVVAQVEQVERVAPLPLHPRRRTRRG
jgi:hypothetical protein